MTGCDQHDAVADVNGFSSLGTGSAIRSGTEQAGNAGRSSASVWVDSTLDKERPMGVLCRIGVALRCQIGVGATGPVSPGLSQNAQHGSPGRGGNNGAGRDWDGRGGDYSPNIRSR